MNVMSREFKLFKRSGEWFMFILTPVIIVVCISMAISGSVHNVPIGVASTNSQDSVGLLKALNADNGKISANLINVVDVNQSFVKGNLESVILVNTNSTGYHTITIYIDSTDQALKEQMQSYLTVLLYNYYADYNLKINVVEEYSGYSFTDNYAPTKIMISALMGGVFMSSDSILKERVTKTIENVIVTGFNTFRFTTEKILSFVLLQSASTILIYGALAVLGLPLGDVEQIITIILGIVIVQFIFVSIGFIMSGLVPNSEIAGALGGTIMFPLMFISGAFYSVYSMSPLVIPIAQVNPVTLGQNLFTTIILKNGTFNDVIQSLLLLTGIGLLFFTLANFFVYRVTNSLRSNNKSVFDSFINNRV